MPMDGVSDHESAPRRFQDEVDLNLVNREHNQAIAGLRENPLTE